MPNFPENKHFLPPKMFVFRKIWRASFSWNTRFEIRTFGIFYRRYLFSWKSRQDHICVIIISWVLIHSCLRQSLFGKWSFFKYGWNPLELSMKEFVFMWFATSFVYVVAVTNTQGPLGTYMYVQINNKDTRFMFIVVLFRCGIWSGICSVRKAVSTILKSLRCS